MQETNNQSAQSDINLSLVKVQPKPELVPPFHVNPPVKEVQ